MGTSNRESGGGEAYGIDKGTKIEENGIKCDDGHRLEGIAVNYICCNNGVAYLDAGRNWSWDGEQLEVR